MPKNPTDTQTATAFLWSIDVLRFLLAFMVVCGHAYGFLHLDRPDAYSHVFERIESGGLWVSGFFVLSGWCIVAGSGAPEHFDFRRYMAARLTRILPLYLFFLVAVLLAEAVFAHHGGRSPEPWIVHPWTLLAQLTMTQGLFGPFGAYNPSWSLTHELACYLVWGLLVVAVGRRLRGSTVLGLAVAPLVAAAAVHAIVHDENSWRLLTLPLYFFVWLLGGAAAESRDALEDPARRRHLYAAIAVFAPILIWFAVDLRVPDTVGMIAFAVLLAVSLLWLERLPAAGPRLEAASRRLGLASYPLYLGHGIVLVATTVYCTPDDPLVRAVAAVVVSAGLALVFGVPLERAGLAWRSRWLRRTFADDRCDATSRRIAPTARAEA